MPFLQRRDRGESGMENPAESINPSASSGSPQKVTFLAVLLGIVASMGGFMFGYVSGQISGFLKMGNFKMRFGHLTGPDPADADSWTFSAAQTGAIVALLCVGALFGSLIGAKLADWLGRRRGIQISASICCVGTTIEISSTTWIQFAIGRLVNGLGIGALSVAVPMYQSESAPAILRGIMVASYQLFITFGIWLSYMIDFGTQRITSTASWRIPNGLSLLWALTLIFGMEFLPESPRYAYRKGDVQNAQATIARLAGLDTDSREVSMLINQIRVNLGQERAGAEAKWHEFLTGPRMLYRVVLGVVLQAGQQLTGANVFFYFGTTIFSQAGLEDPYVTQIVLGTVNMVCTFGGLYVVQKCGRRKALMVGAAWMVMCFLVYSFVGHFGKAEVAGNVLVVFTCFFIAAFAMTWGPLVWGVVAELYPSKYRAPCLALATIGNWLFNFILSFVTPFAVDKIGYFYGLVFGGCCAALFFIVYFFLNEHKDRSLEEIDTMYTLGIDPKISAKWVGNRTQHVSESRNESQSTEGHSFHEKPKGQAEPRFPSRT